MTSDPAAEEIAEEILYLTGKAIMAGQFDHFKVHFALPQVIETLSGSKLLQTETDMRAVFDGVQKQLRENAVAELVRTITCAEFIDSDTIGSTHVSCMLHADGSRFKAPYPTYSILKRASEGWKIAGSRVVMLDSDHLDQLLLASGGSAASPERPGNTQS